MIIEDDEFLLLSPDWSSHLVLYYNNLEKHRNNELIDVLLYYVDIIVTVK